MGTLMNKLVRFSAAGLTAGAFTLASLLGSGASQAEAAGYDDLDNVVLAACSSRYPSAMTVLKAVPSGPARKLKLIEYTALWLAEGEQPLSSSDIRCHVGLEARINELVGATANLSGGRAFLKLFDEATGTPVLTAWHGGPIRSAISFTDSGNRVDYIALVTERKHTDLQGRSFTYPVVSLAALSGGSFGIIADNPVVEPIYRPEGPVKAGDLEYRLTRNSFIIGITVKVPMINSKGQPYEGAQTVWFDKDGLPPIGMPILQLLENSGPKTAPQSFSHGGVPFDGLVSIPLSAVSAAGTVAGAGQYWRIEQLSPAIHARGKSRAWNHSLKQPVLQQVKPWQYTANGYRGLAFAPA